MRVFIIATMVVLSAGSALAQKPMPRYGETDDKKTPSEIESERKADADYKRSIGNVPNAGPTDPWGNMRGESAKPAPKAAPAKSNKPVN